MLRPAYWRLGTASPGRWLCIPARRSSRTSSIAHGSCPSFRARTLRGPDWSLPAGFPDPPPPVRGLYQGQLVALLREKEGALWTCANLRGGL